VNGMENKINLINTHKKPLAPVIQKYLFEKTFCIVQFQIED